jgi:two-component system response regulator FixJ
MATTDERPVSAVSAAPRLDRSDPNPAARTVHVIDDDEPVRRAVAMLLRSAGMPAETYSSGTAFLDTLPSLSDGMIGCVLSDVRMPDLDGLELLSRLKGRGFGRPVIIMTAHGDISTAVQAMKAGAADFIEKPFDEHVLLEACEAALRVSLAPDTAGTDAAARVAALSAREREVLNLLMTGKSNKQVAFDLNISSRTVEVHRANLMARLGVGSLAEAVRLAMQAELGRRAGTAMPVS